METIKLRDENGAEIRGVVIETKELAALERAGLVKVATACTPGQLEAVLAECEGVLTEVIDVNDYIKRAEVVAEFCTLLWSKTGSPNLFHYHRKRISPEIYGRPETFRADVGKLEKDLRSALEVYDEIQSQQGIISVASLALDKPDREGR